jgi:hypothetical protein
MKSLGLAFLLAAGPALAGGSVTSVPASPASRPAFRKVLIVLLENADYKEALAQPYLAELARRGALLTNYHAVAHPSQPNYVALIAGDTLGVKDDEKVEFSSATRQLGDLLEAAGRTWGVYAEGYPAECDPRTHIGLYARKHQPFMSFTGVSTNPERCARIKPASELDRDAAAGKLPDYSLYIPDLANDGHDTGTAFASRWLQESFGPRFADPGFMKDLLVAVTFDEDGGTRDNRVYAVLLGPGVRPGSTSAARYTHYSLLKTVETAFRLGDLGRRDASAAVIQGVWETN